MSLLQQNISTWAWRLLPGNPIFVRVLQGGSRRMRHLWIRLSFLSVLFFVMFVGLVSFMPGRVGLDDLAKGSTQVFRFVSIAQLAMICFLAPIFMAAAITQEKDSQTYNILLSTPMSNAQIVLGSLMSRLFFVLVLLLASVPIYCATTLYGGVTLRQILLSTSIAASTAILTGSLAIALSVIRVGTRRTIFSFYLAIALYLLVVGAMGYPRSHRRETADLRFLERQKAMEAWVADGNPRPARVARLLYADPENLDKAVKASLEDKPLARKLLDRLREADRIGALRQEEEVTLFGCRLAPANVDGQRMSWLAPFHPLLALQVALGLVDPPPASAAMWPMNELLTAPHYGYIATTLVASVLIIAMSMLFVRRGAREGEQTFLTWLTGRFGRTISHNERRRKPRRVWRNPVAWREAMTKASFTGRGLMRHVLVIAGFLCVLVLLGTHFGNWGWLSPKELRFWLTGLFIVEVALILLMATSSAATAITREREANTMDLLLSTPLTSAYILRGKVRGLVSFLIPLILVPVLSLTAFALGDLATGSLVSVVWIEAGIELGLLLVVYTAFACVLGLKMSLQFRRTVPAVLTSVGIIIAVSFALGACGWGLVGVSDAYGAVVAPFTPFTAVSLIVNPAETLGLADRRGGATLAMTRSLVPIGVVLATAFYSMIVVGMYQSMIKNFDMTVRKQSV